jgi:Na+-translocating ferredoxin:NAD+ oxidoreductase subunit B
MTTEIYEQLREQLDQYSVGFPATESGVEVRLLQKLFTEEEARMYLDLSLMLETPEAVAQRTGRNAEEVAALLGRMADKGLIFRGKKIGAVQYGAVPFVVGSYEFQLNTMDRELAQLVEEYFTGGFLEKGMRAAPPLRVIPVNQSIPASWEVAPYEDIREIIKKKDVISLSKCICRVQQRLLDKGCDKPLEVCFMFGSHAQFYVEKGMARFVTQEEALRVVDRCDEAGLVPQPFNAQDPGGFCNCCGDCCGQLRALRMHPKPAELVASSYYAAVDPELCAACGTCLERCQMAAITTDADDIASVDRDRCIGCGLCVTTCPSEAMQLHVKPEAERRMPPAKGKDTMMQMAQQRGKTLIPLSVTKK